MTKLTSKEAITYAKRLREAEVNALADVINNEWCIKVFGKVNSKNHKIALRSVENAVLFVTGAEFAADAWRAAIEKGIKETS